MYLEPVAHVEWSNLAAASPVEAAGPRAVPPFMFEPPDRQMIGHQATVPVPRDALAGRSSAFMPPPLVSTNFLALGDPGNIIPPDTHGAVGPDHVMTMLNTQVRIHDKTGATISTVSLAVFWSPLLRSGRFDPRLMYDRNSGRWLATCDSNSRSANSSILFAISSTSNPTGAWTFYRIDGRDQHQLGRLPGPRIQRHLGGHYQQHVRRVQRRVRRPCHVGDR